MRKKLPQFDFHEDYYKGIKGIYFYRILKKIIKIGNLKNENVKILDFGCGLGKLKQLLGNKVINYDVVNDLTEVKDWRKVKFDIIVASNVFYLLTKNELKKFLEDLYKINPDVKLIVSMSRHGLLNKIIQALVGYPNVYNDTNLEPNEQLNLLKERMNILRHTSVFLMNDIYLLSFK